MLVETDKRYRLDIGVWRWTSISADTESPKFFDTKKECYDEIRKSREFLQRIGRGIWYAEIRDLMDGGKLVGYVPSDPEPPRLTSLNY